MPEVLNDEQGRRAVVELFTHFDADAFTNLAAAWARLLGLGQVVFDTLTRQMIG